MGIANMAADGTNSSSALSLNFCFGGRNTIGHQFLHLAFRTGIKLWWSADGTFLPATVAIPVVGRNAITALQESRIIKIPRQNSVSLYRNETKNLHRHFCSRRLF